MDNFGDFLQSAFAGFMEDVRRTECAHRNNYDADDAAERAHRDMYNQSRKDFAQTVTFMAQCLIDMDHMQNHSCQYNSECVCVVCGRDGNI